MAAAARRAGLSAAALSLAVLLSDGLTPVALAGERVAVTSRTDGNAAFAFPGPVARMPILRVGPHDEIHFVPNTFAFWDDPRFATTTDPPKPAYADVLLAPSNFLPCKGGPFALCYYSGPGPEVGGIDLSCNVTEDGRFANCKCYEIPYGAYFVDINAILNYGVYLQTIDACGTDGSNCAVTNSAPVCDAINRNDLIPGADLVSTFSFDCVPTDGIGQTSCAQAPYAGCMTAPCQRKEEDDPGIVECSCPIFDGPYQVGEDEASCQLEGNRVWSAAYAPSGQTFPTPPGCVPDAPGTVGCPLYQQGQTILPPGTDCAAICSAYACAPGGEVEPAYTCDATLCTSECNDRVLVAEACQNLAKCPSSGLDEIIKLEAAAQCSCCASQLCGCEPNAQTNEAIAALNDAQRALGITPQCDVNGTLCGD
jgi:hypothetical protein